MDGNKNTQHCKTGGMQQKWGFYRETCKHKTAYIRESKRMTMNDPRVQPKASERKKRKRKRH